MSHPPSTFYFAGDLFDSKDLVGNALLAEAIFEVSRKRYLPVLPQNLEQRETSAHSIRDNDLFCLIDCDLALFHFDGSELDSGTVVEFMVAKFCDIPSVILRTDFRAKGDQAEHPWNLMASFYPRTEVVVLDAMDLYQKALKGKRETDAAIIQSREIGSKQASAFLKKVAKEVCEAMDRVAAAAPVLPAKDTEQVYHWLARMPGFAKGAKHAETITNAALHRKRAKGLLK